MKCAPISFKSDYSLLKSILKIKDIVDYAVSMEAQCVGILDENPFAIMDFMSSCSNANIKGVCGVIIKIGDTKIYLYIKDYEGYLNIIKIYEFVEDGSLTIEKLIKYNTGLICVLPYENYNLFNRFRTSFTVYLGYKNQAELDNAIQISKNVLFLTEMVCLKKEDEPLLRILYKISGRDIDPNDKWCREMTEFDESTILRVANECSLEFDYKKRYIPQFCKSEEESRKLLYALAAVGLEKRLDGHVKDEYRMRLEHELDVISTMGFVDYFLIVYDYVKFAKKNDIYVGPGRGSAAGSLVSYTLGITDIDPIKYDLLFERFLNPERITMPDIDLDFEDVRRGEVIEYVRGKYGKDAVSLIVAYGTFGARQAIRDVGKVLGVDEQVLSELSKRLDSKLSLLENARNELVSNFVKERKLEKLYKLCMRIEGLKKNTTIHAAGVIISSIPLNNIIPTYNTSSGLLAGFTMEHLEKLGLLKMDFLALRNLTIIHNTVIRIANKNPRFNLKKIPLDDARTYETVFKRANTDNVFQFETAGMRGFLKKLSPQNFDDLIAAIALFRPGPMQNIDEYIARKNGMKKIDYLHPDLEPILKETYGIIIYQEQIMQILVKMGNYSYAEADTIRRAMSKKKKNVMVEERTRFKSRCVANGYEEKLAEKVYDLILRFADYGFPKAHSVAYAFIAYQMAYLKANYPSEFQSNNLNMNSNSARKIKDVIDEARQKGFKILRPNINTSKEEYLINEDKVILPLQAIKGITGAQSKTIVTNQPYEDLFDFVKKTYQKGINRACLEAIIKAGAMDDICESRGTILKNIDSALTYIELINNLDESLVEKPVMEKYEGEEEKISELDLFGFYVDGHPASKYTGKGIVKIRNIESFLNRPVKVIGFVEKVKVINTKKGEKMAFVQITDDTGSKDAVIFPKNMQILDTIGPELNGFIATVGKRNDELQLILEKQFELEEKDGNDK